MAGAAAAADYYLAAEMRGRRPEMEDAHVIFFSVDLNNTSTPATDREACMFGVFDGHGGDECARFLAQNLCKEIYTHALLVDDPRRAMEDAFVQIDAQYLHLAKQLDLEDGSTAAVLYLAVDPDSPASSVHYHLANVGDSRAILVKRDGTARCLVEDHTPERADERARVKRDGGLVAYDEDNDMYRVSSEQGGGLAVTRAFGDYAFKPFVTARPEVAQGEIGPDDAYILLASDGLWGDLSNEEVGFALVERPAQDAVEYVMQEAFSRGSDDNITVILVDLQRAKQRLVLEHQTRPLPPRVLQLSSPRPRSVNRTNTSSRLSNSSAASPLLLGDTDNSEHAAALVAADPLLVSVARKMSNAMQLKIISTQVDDVEIPGLPLHFSNDLVLWRDPVKTFLWFVTFNLMFYLAVFRNVSLVTLIATSAALRLVLAFMACRVLQVYYRVRPPPPPSEDANDVTLLRCGQFVDGNFLVSQRSMRYFASTITGVICTVAAKWDDLILNGSTTNLLITLRTLTYLYTPTPIAGLAWMIFIFVFTVPATYARHKQELEAKADEITTRVKVVVQPYVDRAKAKAQEVEDSVRNKLGRPAAAAAAASRQQERKPSASSSSATATTTTTTATTPATPAPRTPTRTVSHLIGTELSEDL